MHFSAVGEPTQIVRPLDRETGRARGFAFVEYADRAVAEAAIKQFDGQLFMGRPLAVSEARAREDRGPGGPRPGGGYGGPRPGGFSGPRPGGYSGPRPGVPGGPPRPGGFGPPRPGESPATQRERNFGPPAPPKGKKGKGSFQQKERGPKGPIPTKFTGRMYDLDEVDATEDAADEVPEFMKPEASSGEDEPAGASDTGASDTGASAGVGEPGADEDESPGGRRDRDDE